MQQPEDLTYGVPRFLSFIELAYLFEAAKAADEHLAAKLQVEGASSNRDTIGNLNATRQSLLRAVFVSSYGILEQNLDELVLMEGAKLGTALVPSDLNGRGIKRSLAYANKVLDKKINLAAAHWKDLFLIQDLRNHLIHYGPDFGQTKEHDDRFEKFSNCRFVTLRPIICFTMIQIEKMLELYLQCIDDLR